jgi:hypothetical protein
MVKRIVLEKAGGFDERYFMYAEDIDLSLTIKRLGFRTSIMEKKQCYILKEALPPGINNIFPGFTMPCGCS